MQIKSLKANSLIATITAAAKQASSEGKEIVYGVELTDAEYQQLKVEIAELVGQIIDNPSRVPPLDLPIFLNRRDLVKEEREKFAAELGSLFKDVTGDAGAAGKDTIN